MKIKLMAGLVSGFLCLSALSLAASESPEVNIFRKAFAGVTAKELPLKAASLVKAARAEDREETTKDVVRAALEIKSAAVLEIVNAIGRDVPEMASVAAATIGEQRPQQAAAAARAAALAAPSMAGRIVQAVCRSVPDDYRNIAVAVAQVVPASGKEILDGVSATVPAASASIKLSVLSYGGNVTSVADVLDQANSIPRTKALATDLPVTVATSAPGGPTVGPPFIPLTRTPANVGPANSGVVPAPARAQVAP